MVFRDPRPLVVISGVSSLCALYHQKAKANNHGDIRRQPLWPPITRLIWQTEHTFKRVVRLYIFTSRARYFGKPAGQAKIQSTSKNIQPFYTELNCLINSLILCPSWPTVFVFLFYWVISRCWGHLLGSIHLWTFCQLIPSFTTNSDF